MGRNPNDKFPTVRTTRKRRRYRFPGFFHIGDDFCDNLPNPTQSGFGRLSQPAQTGKFQAKPDMLLILFRPSDSIGETIILWAHRVAPAFPMLTKSVDHNDTYIDTIINTNKRTLSLYSSAFIWSEANASFINPSRRIHQLADRIEHNFKLSIVFLFQVIELSG
jgi:hypothetical protein